MQYTSDNMGPTGNPFPYLTSMAEAPGDDTLIHVLKQQGEYPKTPSDILQEVFNKSANLGNVVKGWETAPDTPLAHKGGANSNG